MIKANQYRTVTCGELREENIGQEVRVAGWVENIRDHGGVMFLDIRDQYGVLQVVVHNDELLKGINKECTVTLSGKVVKRDEETINLRLLPVMLRYTQMTLLFSANVKTHFRLRLPLLPILRRRYA